MGHNVGAAAANAVKNSERKSASEFTPEQLIHELRKNIKALLFVPQHQIQALLSEYDRVAENLRTEKLTTVDLAAQCVAAEKAVTALEAESDRQALTIRAQYDVITGNVISFDALGAEKAVMTDTIFGLTQKVQELQGEIDKVALAIHERENPSDEQGQKVVG